ncbi:hypothetical protein D3C79_724140 [compost metagenome]
MAHVLIQSVDHPARDGQVHVADGGEGQQRMVEAAELGPHHHYHRQILLPDPVRQQISSVQGQEPAPRPLDDHQLGTRLLDGTQPCGQAAQGDGLPHLASGDMGCDRRLIGKWIDQIVGQRQAGGGLQQQGILVAQPLGGAGAARRDGFVTGA